MALNNKGILYAYGKISIDSEDCEIAQTNGVDWSQVGFFASDFSVRDESIYAIACDSSCGLYVAGSFSVSEDVVHGPSHNIAKFDRGYWIPNGLGTNDTVFAIAFDKNGVMYAAGSFTGPGLHITYFSGDCQVKSWLNGSVDAITFDADKNLCVVGEFTKIPGDSAKHSAKWDGNVWSALGLGTNGFIRTAISDQSGNIFCGGYFDTAGTVKAKNIAKWNGADWSAIGSGFNKGVNALAFNKNGDLFAGGPFDTSNGVAVNHVAEWDGNSWNTVGTGINSFVDALAIDSNGNLYAGGIFVDAGGKAINHIAKWNGNEWSPLGSGLNAEVYSLVCDNKGNLYAGGMFDTAGGVAAHYVAKWDGNTWSALGTGMAASKNKPYVNCLAFDKNGNLFCGGHFDTAGPIKANSIAKWNGAKWEPLGSGVGDGAIGSIALSDSTLYLSGNFSKAGNFVSNNIAKVNIHDIPISSVLKSHVEAQKFIHYRIIQSALTIYNITSSDHISLYSLSGRCVRQAEGVSRMDLSGLSPQPLLIQIHREGKIVLTGIVMAQ
jgi:hypothetical protein